MLLRKWHLALSSIASSGRRSYVGSMASSLKTQENAALGAGASRRRSMRVLLSIGIQISGKTVSKEDFVEDTRTLVVNAHGALICLATPVAAGQLVKLTHKA